MSAWNAARAAGALVSICLLAAVGCGDATGGSSDAASTPAAGSGEVVASWGDQTITLAELDKATMAGEAGEVYSELYDARKKMLDAMVAERLVELEAEELGVEKGQLVQENIIDRTERPTAEQVQAFYNQNQAQINGTLDEVYGQIERYMWEQDRTLKTRQYREQLEEKYGVTKSLDPVRFPVTVAENDPRKGPDSAPVRIVEWSDFQCPFCARVGPAFKQVVAEYGDDVQIVFRDYPLPANMHPEAQISAEAGQCAHEQGRFWELHDKMFNNQRALKAPDLKRYAAEIGLDVEAFSECLDSNRHREAVLADHREGLSIGVRGTPAIFINGRRVKGAPTFDAMKAMIDEELAAGS